MSFQFKGGSSDGKYLFLREGEPLTVKLLEDLGQVEAIGKFAKDPQGNQRMVEAFRVVYDGKEKTLIGGWRLRVALRTALAESQETEPFVKLSVSYQTEKLKNGSVVAVKHYACEEVTPF